MVESSAPAAQAMAGVPQDHVALLVAGSERALALVASFPARLLPELVDWARAAESAERTARSRSSPGG